MSAHSARRHAARRAWPGLAVLALVVIAAGRLAWIWAPPTVGPLLLALVCCAGGLTLLSRRAL